MANWNDTAGELYFKHIPSLNSILKGIHAITVRLQLWKPQIAKIKNNSQYNNICEI